VRYRTMASQDADERQYLLSKLPLIKFDPSCRLYRGQQGASHPQIAGARGALLHFKYFEGFHRLVEAEIERGQKWKDSHEYKQYAQTLAKDPELSLYDPAHSVRFENSQQLVELGVMLVLDQGAPAPDYDLNLARSSFERGKALKAKDDLLAAAVAFRAATKTYPDYLAAINNLGTTLQRLEEYDEAIACYQRVLELNPDQAETHSNMAAIWQEQGQMDQAKAGFKRALELKPDYLPALTNLSGIYLLQQEPELALELYHKMAEIDPEDTYIFFQINRARLMLDDWQDYDARYRQFMDLLDEGLADEEGALPNPFELNSMPVSPDTHLQVARRFASSIERNLARLGNAPYQDYKRRSGSKIRVGYISPDLRNHAVGRLIYTLFEHHDRERFEVFSYDLVNIDDHVNNTIRAGSDKFRRLYLVPAADAAEQIWDDGLDILVDLGGYTTHTHPEILALRPAPVQAHFMGFPGTMGADFIQYYLADDWLVPTEMEPFYSEQVIRLPHAFVGSPLPVSEREMTRAEFGLPEDAPILACFNDRRKIDPQVFDAWMRILRAVPGSVLWLTEASETTVTNLRGAATERDIDPDRLRFAPFSPLPDYLARYQLVDLFLDTFLYCAGSTAVAALWSGTPVLTCAGETNAQRMGASIVSAVDLESLICESPEAYTQRAISLLNNPDEMSWMRRHLMDQRAQLPLFDLVRFARDLEQVYEQIKPD